MTQIIKNQRVVNNSKVTGRFLVEWMEENDVFDTLFDPKKTHLQLVQRSEEVIRLLI